MTDFEVWLNKSDFKIGDWLKADKNKIVYLKIAKKDETQSCILSLFYCFISTYIYIYIKKNTEEATEMAAKYLHNKRMCF